MEFKFKDNKLIVGVVAIVVICGLIIGVVYANREEDGYEALENFDNENTILNNEENGNFEEGKENGEEDSDGKSKEEKDGTESENRRK